MRAFVLPSFDEPPSLREDLPEPTPADGEVLVRVRWSSANPVDNGIASGGMMGRLDHEFPVTIGRDFGGVVEETGEEVYGFIRHAEPKVHAGTWAELIAVTADFSIAVRPESLDLEAAGSAALAGITAMACVDAVELSPDNSVLIVGANGGVGVFAVQLAVQAGARVIAPGLPEDEAFLRELGVSEVIDRDADLSSSVRELEPDGVDAIIDSANRDSARFEEGAAVLREGGRGSSPTGAAGEGPGRSNVGAAPTVENLERLARLIDEGGMKVPIQRRYELSDAAQALADLAGTHKQGKLAVHVG